MNSVLYTYDVAVRLLLYTRFASLLGINSEPTQEGSVNKGVLLVPKGIAQREVSEKRQQIFLDFINTYRTSVRFSWPRQNTVISRRGFEYLSADGSSGTVKADAVDVEYNAWFWSDSLDKVNTCIEKYIQWQHETPQLTIVFQDIFQLTPILNFSPVSDESQIEDVFQNGKVWCYRMPIYVEAWLPKTPSVTSLVHRIQLTIYDKDELQEYETVLTPESSQDSDLEAALRMFRSNLFQIVLVSSAQKIFYLRKNQTAQFPADSIFFVENSTDTDGRYTVDHSSYDVASGRTLVYVKETIPGSTSDGNIYKVDASE